MFNVTINVFFNVWIVLTGYLIPTKRVQWFQTKLFWSIYNNIFHHKIFLSIIELRHLKNDENRILLKLNLLQSNANYFSKANQLTFIKNGYHLWYQLQKFTDQLHDLTIRNTQQQVFVNVHVFCVLLMIFLCL